MSVYNSTTKRRALEKTGLKVSKKYSNSNGPRSDSKDYPIWKLAEEMREKRLKELKSGIGIETATRQDFFAWCDAKGFTEHKIYSYILKHLKKYVKSDKLKFNKITVKFSRGFAEYMKSIDLGDNTVHNYLVRFKALINKAYKEQLITHKPTEFIDMPKLTDAKRHALSIDNFNKIRNVDLSSKPHLDYSRTAFIFQTLTACRLSDLKNLKWTDISKDNFLTFTQVKTKEPVKQKLGDDRLAILEKLDKSTTYIFSELRTQPNYNKHLKEIAKIADIRDENGEILNLHNHIARHTGASFIIAGKASIAQGMAHTGHKSVKVYTDYLTTLEEQIAETESIISNVINRK